jgi:hypothetical protein
VSDGVRAGVSGEREDPQGDGGGGGAHNARRRREFGLRFRGGKAGHGPG